LNSTVTSETDSKGLKTVKPPRRGRSIWQWASIAISAGLMIYVLAKIDWNEFMGHVRSFPAWAIAGAVVTYFLLNFFRTFRFRTFMPHPHPAIAELLPIVLYHNFLTRVLPFKTGEISYVILCNRYLKQPVSEGISSLLSARLFELALVILGGAFGVLSITTDTEQHRVLIFAGIIVFLIVYMIALYYSGSILRFVSRMWTRLLAPHIVRRFPKFENRVEEKLHLFAGQFDRIHNPRLLLAACLMSTGTYGASIAFDVILLRGLGLTNPIGVLITVISIKQFIEAAPIAVSGFGAIEGSWQFGLTTVAGLDATTAASFSLFLHVTQVLIAGVIGLTGWFVLARFRTPVVTSELKATP
jgi:uncharacterized protein (TIRG00374 family)